MTFKDISVSDQDTNFADDNRNSALLCMCFTYFSREKIGVCGLRNLYVNIRVGPFQLKFDLLRSKTVALMGVGLL